MCPCHMCHKSPSKDDPQNRVFETRSSQADARGEGAREGHLEPPWPFLLAPRCPTRDRSLRRVTWTGRGPSGGQTDVRMCRAQHEGNVGRPCVCGGERRGLPRGRSYLRKPHGELSLGWNLEVWKGRCCRPGGDKTALTPQPQAAARRESRGQSKTVVWVTRCGGVEPTTSESAREGCGRQEGVALVPARAPWRSGCCRVRTGRPL